MSRDLLLTIITITKDDAVGLARTLASTEAWRKEDWVEQIVIDASSEPAVAGDSRVRVVRQRSTGISGAFNEGLAQAQGTWVWFLNGGDEIDSRLSPGWLRELLVATKAEVVIGGTVFPEGVSYRPPPPKWQWPPLVPWIPHPSTLVRRGLFERYGPFDPSFAIAMDFEWWLRALSGDVRVDQVGLPFSIFAPGGLSLREDMRGQTRRETAAAVWKHRKQLLRSWAGITRRMLGGLARAGWVRAGWRHNSH